jgi:hypothetical protein
MTPVVIGPPKPRSATAAPDAALRDLLAPHPAWGAEEILAVVQQEEGEEWRRALLFLCRPPWGIRALFATKAARWRLDAWLRAEQAVRQQGRAAPDPAVWASAATGDWR